MSNYADEKLESEKEDLRLGFEIAGLEIKIRERLAAENQEAPSSSQTWNHLSPQIFQTPYAELERMIAAVDPEATLPRWVDLGAAYGRLGIVLSQVRPNASFLGIELVPERVEEAARVFKCLELPHAEIRCANLTEIDLPEGDLYFIYDFGTRQEIASVLAKLKERARIQPVRVVGRGRLVRDTIEREHPWLSSVVSPVHTEHYSYYRSA
jgi:hypothetical protein